MAMAIIKAVQKARLAKPLKNITRLELNQFTD